MRAPEYVIMQTHKISKGIWEEKELPEGSFVLPINPAYLPAHITSDVHHNFFDPRLEVYCYTRYGIVILPKNVIRRVI